MIGRRDQNSITIIADDIRPGTVHEEIAESPLLIDTGLPFGSIDGKSYVEEQERKTGEIFEKWRVFRIETHIAESDIAVG